MDIGEIFGKIGFDWKMALFNLVNFLIVFAILYKFLFSRITKILEERQKKVQESYSSAEQIEKELNEARKKADEIIDESQKRASEIISEGQDQAQKTREQMLKEAQGDVEKMISRTKDQISKEKNQMVNDLREDISGMVVDLTEKLTKEKLDASTEKEIAQELIASTANEEADK